MNDFQRMFLNDGVPAADVTFLCFVGTYPYAAGGCSYHHHPQPQIPRASVTPLRVVCQPPELEMSSGVTRQYARHSERFVLLAHPAP